MTVMCYSPPCITARRGRLRHQENAAKPPQPDAGGVVFLLFSFGKPPRPRDQRRLRGIFLIARPPLLAVMQGGEFARLRFPAHSVFLKPFGILAEIRISEGGDPNPGAETESERKNFRYFMATLA